MLERAEAAATLVAALSALEGNGKNLVTALIGDAAFTTLTHYPADDIIDPKTKAQYYFHAHRGTQESDHIHCFLRGAGPCGELSHVAAVALDHHGRLAKLFTTNLWMTDDEWVEAETFSNLLPHLDWSSAPGPAPVNTALTALFVLYRREIVALLRRRAHSRWPYSTAADIEDTVQETLLALHQNRHLYDPARPLAPFLFGILKLRGADVRRRRQRHAGRETTIEDVPVTFSGLMTNETQETDTDRTAMLAAISELSERDKLVLELLKLRQLSLREASVQTGMSIVALKVASFRAMQRLRTLMKGTDSDGN